MNAGAAGLVVCAYPGSCCQPGTVLVVCGRGDNAAVLEFRAKHSVRARTRWGC